MAVLIKVKSRKSLYNSEIHFCTYMSRLFYQNLTWKYISVLILGGVRSYISITILNSKFSKFYGDASLNAFNSYTCAKSFSILSSFVANSLKLHLSSLLNM